MNQIWRKVIEISTQCSLKIAGRLQNPDKKNKSHKQMESNNRSVSCYNCWKPWHYLCYCKSKQKNKGGWRVAELEKAKMDLMEKMSKVVFSKKSSNNGQLVTPVMKLINLVNSDINELINISNLLNIWPFNEELTKKFRRNWVVGRRKS